MGKHDVQDDELGFELKDFLEAFGTRVGRVHDEFFREGRADGVDDDRLVLDDDDARLGTGVGHCDPQA
jgi:hypothetical protein